MAEFIEIDGKQEVVLGMDDFVKLVGQHMGFEAETYLRNWICEQKSNIEEVEALEDQVDKMTTHTINVYGEIRSKLNELSNMIWSENYTTGELGGQVDLIDDIILSEL
ncbi:MAG: hypothetical protein J5800_09825 [Spirochaetales bacterium]|nr:hypothetical protein [Spirochaetales bacterium]